MDEPASRARLIIVCGLPGSGKTTHAKQLEAKLRAVRFCPDEWMDALSVDIWEERMRGKIEALQWQLGQKLLALGVNVIPGLRSLASGRQWTLHSATRGV